MKKKSKVSKDSGQAPKNYFRLLFVALVTGPNHLFNEYMQHIADVVESGTGFNAGIKADQIVKGARSKYNNMSVRKQWNKVDLRDAELLALKTQVTNLEKKREATPTVLATEGTKKSKKVRESHLDWNVVEGTKVFKWRTVKNRGESRKVNWTTWYWCTPYGYGTADSTHRRR